MFIFYFIYRFYIRTYYYLFLFLKKIIKIKSSSSFLWVYNDLYEIRKSSNLKINLYELYILAFFLTRKYDNKYLWNFINKNVWFEISDLDKLLKFEKDYSEVIDYNKLSQDKYFLSNLFGWLIFKIITYFILSFFIFIIIIFLSLIFNSFNYVKTNFFDDNIINTTLSWSEDNNSFSSWSQENKNNKSNTWSEEDENKNDLENNKNTSSWVIDDLNNTFTWSSWSLSDDWEIYYKHISIKDWKKVETIVKWNNPVDDLYKNNWLDPILNNYQKTESSSQISTTQTSQTELLKSTYRYVIRELKSMLINIYEYVFVNSFFWILIIIFLLLLSFIYLVRFFKDKIWIYLLITLILNTSLYVFFREYLFINLIFSILIFICLIIYLFDYLFKSVDVLNSKINLLIYYYSRNLLFWITLFIVIFLVSLFWLYLYDLSFFNKIILYLWLNIKTLWIDSNYLFKIYIIICFSFAILLVITHFNIYSNIRKIYNNSCKWNYSQNELKELIKSWNNDTIFRYFLKNASEIEKIRIFLLNYLYNDNNIRYDHLEYLIDLAWNNYTKFIKSSFSKTMQMYYSKNYFKQKLIYIKNIKFNKNNFWWVWEFKVISYLDKGDDYSYIKNVNVKKSIKMWMIILNVYEEDKTIRNIENLYIDLYELMKEKNLVIFKDIIRKIDSKELKIKYIFLNKWDKLVSSFKFISSKNLIKRISIFISKFKLRWKEVIVPKFVKEINNENLELIFNIAFDKITLWESSKNKVKTRKVWNNLIIWN